MMDIIIMVHRNTFHLHQNHSTFSPYCCFLHFSSCLFGGSLNERKKTFNHHKTNDYRHSSILRYVCVLVFAVFFPPNKLCKQNKQKKNLMKISYIYISLQFKYAIIEKIKLIKLNAFATQSRDEERHRRMISFCCVVSSFKCHDMALGRARHSYNNMNNDATIKVTCFIVSYTHRLYYTYTECNALYLLR